MTDKTPINFIDALKQASDSITQLAFQIGIAKQPTSVEKIAYRIVYFIRKATYQITIICLAIPMAIYFGIKSAIEYYKYIE